MIRVNVAGNIIQLLKLYKRWETESEVSLTFISSVFLIRLNNKQIRLGCSKATGYRANKQA
jgi:hypothetical protein